MLKFEDFEDAKENIFPIKQGRNLNLLSNPSIESERSIKYKSLQTLSKDPLDDYLTYLNFINQHYPISKINIT
jgi:hypothetical protein